MLGSGSRGNATLVASRNCMVMIDCGFSLAESTRRLSRLGVEPEQLDAVLVTHEHSDHISGVGKLARRYGLAVWMTRGTQRVWKDELAARAEAVSPHCGFSIGDIEVQPFPVPHDACEPCQYVLEHQGKKLGILSDAGKITPHICAQLDGCDALLLECNHDPDMLANGPYPPALKERVAGSLGHLSNRQSAALLQRLTTTSLQQLVLTHISEKNNTPGLARAAGESGLGEGFERIVVADQDHGVGWMEIH